MQTKARPPVKPVKFINKQSLKAFKTLNNNDVRLIFTHQLESLIAYGVSPTIPAEPLPGKVLELKVNGKPAYRCVYQVRDNEILVIHTFVKTTNGPDKKNLKTIELRLKALNEADFC